MLSRRWERRLRRILSLCLWALVLNLTLPTPTRIVSAAETVNTETSESISLTSTPPTVQREPLRLPTVQDKPTPPAQQVKVYRSSAYSSTPDQTDGDPFTTASGSKVRPGTIATNCLPFGTKVRIPDHFGDRIFTVEDRMHPRWGCGKIDIWMADRATALEWGVRTVTIEIL